MGPRRIDGIYRSDDGRLRFTEERRLAALARTPRPDARPLAPTPPALLIADVVRLGSPPSSAPAALPSQGVPALEVTSPGLDATQEAARRIASVGEEHVVPPAATEQAGPAATGADELPRRHYVPALLLYAVVVILLLDTTYLGWQTWQTNTHAEEVVAHLSSSDATDVLSEADITNEAKASYAVASDMPRLLTIEKLGVQARVLRMSVTADGAVEAPGGIWDTGWYDGSAKPGEKGNAFIDGHISGPTKPAVFTALEDLRDGDKITIERGDGTLLTYAVTSVKTVKLADVDMRDVLNPNQGETLTLMTCGGGYLGNYSYDSRVIIVSKRT